MIKIHITNRLIDKPFGAGLPDELEVRIGRALHYGLLHYNEFLQWYESKNVGQPPMRAQPTPGQIQARVSFADKSKMASEIFQRSGIPFQELMRLPMSELVKAYRQYL